MEISRNGSHHSAEFLVTVSPLADTLGFIKLAPSYWLFLALMLVVYAVLTQLVKSWFVRRFGE